MLTRIPRAPETDHAPRRAFSFMSSIFNKFEDHNGRPTLSVWMESEPNLPPLYSFQVYVTFELSPKQTSGREALANELLKFVLPDNNLFYKRLDVHFMREGEGTTDFIERHHDLVQAKHADFAKAVVPSYACPRFWDYSSVIFVVSDPDWKQAGLKGVLFDPDPSDTYAKAEPVSERTWSSERIGEILGEVYNDWEFKEAYEDLYSESREEGLTDWKEILDAANRLGVHLQNTAPEMRITIEYVESRKATAGRMTKHTLNVERRTF
ncbi:hypothetical protein IWZ03DRAFT_434300 [Phyllosticta citriasiana]|uniref:Uncharacterized protein n=1 Tax=Phyllosticta citriasiana TaxID=595635 RepID=A0ABR1K7Z9_9PEZI